MNEMPMSHVVRHSQTVTIATLKYTVLWILHYERDSPMATMNVRSPLDYYGPYERDPTMKLLFSSGPYERDWPL